MRREPSQNKYCPHCGDSLNDNDNFCGNCGEKANPVPNTEEAISPEQVSSKNTSFRLFTSLGTYLVMGAIGAGVAGVILASFEIFFHAEAPAELISLIYLMGAIVGLFLYRKRSKTTQLSPIPNPLIETEIPTNITTCKECGTDNQPEAKFCMSCGEKR